MKIVKLPSGSYRVQKMVKGKSYSLTFNHRPTQAEITAELARRTKSLNTKLTFYGAAESYIEARSNVISPGTIREYKGMLSRYSPELMAKLMDDVTSQDIQLEINRFAKTLSAKTVKNYYAFLSSICAEFRPDLRLMVNCPKIIKKEPYVPNLNEIQHILQLAEPTEYYVPILLACCGMRRGEILALQNTDIEGNIIHINKALVMDEHKNWIIKQPKTPSSIRDIAVPDVVINAINERGLYHGNPNSITDWLEDTQKRENMPKFSIHKLRHYFVSTAHAKGIPDADIMAAGGWSTDFVMKRVYRHSMAPDNSAATTAVISDIF